MRSSCWQYSGGMTSVSVSHSEPDAGFCHAGSSGGVRICVPVLSSCLMLTSPCDRLATIGLRSPQGARLSLNILEGSGETMVSNASFIVQGIYPGRMIAVFVFHGQGFPG
jgi:hypothetical protein